MGNRGISQRRMTFKVDAEGSGGGTDPHHKNSTDADLSRCAYRFPGGTLLMPALAGAGWLIEHALAVPTAILAALCHWAFAAEMCALLGFLFSH